jgi:hypothetical protein
MAPALAVDNLHDAMPGDAVAYLRLSGNGTFVGPAPGTPLYEAMTQGDLIELNNNLMTTLVAQLADDPDLDQAAPWMGLVARLRGPIEAVALLSAGAPPPMAKLLLRAGVDVDSASGLDALISEVVAENPKLELTTPLAGGSVGQVTIAGQVPVLYSLDADNKVIYLLSGMAADAAALQAAIASLEPSPDHPMYAIEQQLDSSQQGLFLWADGSLLSAAMAASGKGGTMPPGMIGSVAMGWGTRDGKGHLGVVVDVPRGGMAAMLPKIENNFGFNSRGEPWAFGSLNIPAQQLLTTVEGFLQMAPEANEAYQSSKVAFSASFGLDYAQLAAIFGPELIFFGDDVGEYAAMRVVDTDGYDKLIEGLAKMDGGSYETKDINGVVYHHLAYTQLGASLAAETMAEADAPETDKDRFLNAFTRLGWRARSHVYWLRDGDFLIFGQVPQLLMDRVASQDEVAIDAWLRDRQGQDPTHALAMFSLRMDDVPRRAYYGLLQGMEWIGDVVGKPLDLFVQMPASQLDLPKTGSYGMQLDVGEPYLSLDLSFDFTPFDFFLAKTGMWSAVLIGATYAVAADDEEEMEEVDVEVTEEADQ